MKVSVLGLGMWGFCLARLLALNGHRVVGWTKEEEVLQKLRNGEDHPTLKRSSRGLSLEYTPSLEEAVKEGEVLVESVTTKGLRQVLGEIKKVFPSLEKPLVLTSKGIEQKSYLSTPLVVSSVFGEEAKKEVALISGPSFASEVAQELPTAVVCGAWDQDLCSRVIDMFSSKTFRVYPNKDICGVALGGALKNVVAIACGIARGLHLGVGANAALITRGLHEMVKLVSSQGCDWKTVYGLSGLGDLYLTCSSSESRNFRFGKLLSTGLSLKEAEKQVGMVVEGAYTCRAAVEIAQKQGLVMPIAEAVFDILEGTLSVKDCVDRLMLRSVKEEHL